MPTGPLFLTCPTTCEEILPRTSHLVRPGIIRSCRTFFVRYARASESVAGRGRSDAEASIVEQFGASQRVRTMIAILVHAYARSLRAGLLSV